MERFKLGASVGQNPEGRPRVEDFRKVTHPNTFVYTPLRAGGERIMIAPSSEPLPLLKELVAALEEPLAMRYELSEQTGDRAPAHFELGNVISPRQVKEFLTEFQAFLTQDGRHTLVIGSAERPEQRLVYDSHDLIYGYGLLKEFQRIAERRGLRQADSIEIPVPHATAWHKAFDAELERLLGYFDWIEGSLPPGETSRCDQHGG